MTESRAFVIRCTTLMPITPSVSMRRPISTRAATPILPASMETSRTTTTRTDGAATRADIGGVCGLAAAGRLMVVKAAGLRDETSRNEEGVIGRAVKGCSECSGAVSLRKKGIGVENGQICE